MNARMPKVRHKKWVLLSLVALLAGSVPVYGYFSAADVQDTQDNQITTSSDKAPSPEGKSASKNESSNEESNKDTQQETLAQEDIPRASPPSASQSTISTPKIQTSTKKPVADTGIAPEENVVASENPYNEGSSLWWVYERRVQTGRVIGEWGKTCAEWRTNALKDGVGTTAGPKTHSIMCADISGQNVFAFVEQESRPGGGFVISAYNWANEPGKKVLIMQSPPDGFFFIQP